MRLAQFLAEVARADFADWSRTDIARVTGGWGWRLGEHPRGRALRFESGGDFTADVWPREEYESRWFGEYKDLTVTLDAPPEALDQLHQDALAAAIAALGPPPLVGGPGAFVRWRGKQTSVRLLRASRRLRSRMEVVVEPTEGSEGYEYWNAKWSAEGDWEPSYRWMVETRAEGLPDDVLAGMWFFRHQMTNVGGPGSQPTGAVRVARRRRATAAAVRRNGDLVDLVGRRR